MNVDWIREFNRLKIELRLTGAYYIHGFSLPGQDGNAFISIPELKNSEFQAHFKYVGIRREWDGGQMYKRKLCKLVCAYLHENYTKILKLQIKNENSN